MARIVNAILVDHARLHETAELEEMVPVPAVARDARSLDTKHRSNVTGAQPGDEALETGPRVNTDRGSASEVPIVILHHRDIRRLQKQPGQCPHDPVPFRPVQAAHGILRSRSHEGDTDR